MNTMTKFECGCRVMSDCISLKVMRSGFFVQTLRVCLREVFQETNEIPSYGKHTCGDGKATERNVLEEEERENKNQPEPEN